MTTTVPAADSGVTSLPNRMTDSQISRARFAVLATLEKEIDRLGTRYRERETGNEITNKAAFFNGKMPSV